MRINFCNYKNFFVLSIYCFSNYFLCSAVAVHLRGVNQTHPEPDSQTQRRDLSGALSLVFAHSPSALAKRWNTLSVGQGHRSHVIESNLTATDALQRPGFPTKKEGKTSWATRIFVLFPATGCAKRTERPSEICNLVID